jgi:hypothetical protein
MLKASMRALLAVLVSAGAFQARAEEGGRGTPDEQAACKPDVFRLCSEFIPNEARIVACLKHNREKLSPACKKVFS